MSQDCDHIAALLCMKNHVLYCSQRLQAAMASATRKQVAGCHGQCNNKATIPQKSSRILYMCIQMPIEHTNLPKAYNV